MRLITLTFIILVLVLLAGVEPDPRAGAVADLLALLLLCPLLGVLIANYLTEEV